MNGFDLDGYLQRIGYAGARTPTLDTLFALHRLHAGAIVFEGIDVLCGRGVDLAPAAVDAKLIAARRGGYCFEQNGLFKRALEALGFGVSACLGRVLWGREAKDPPPRTHMALIVTIEGENWLADVGFGGCVMTAPIRLDVREPQALGFEPLRLAPAPGGLQLQARTGLDWQAVYDLDLSPQLDVDFLAPNWWVATHPASLFRNHLLVSRTGAHLRHTLMDNRLTTLARDGTVTHADLDAAAVRDCLTGLFGLPWDEAWTPMTHEAVARGRQRALAAAVSPG